MTETIAITEDGTLVDVADASSDDAPDAIVGTNDEDPEPMHAGDEVIG